VHDPATILPPPEVHAPRRPVPRRLSEELAALAEAFAERAVTLREVMDRLHGRGYTLLLTFLALPFCTPIPLPGLSTPFGLVIALIGLRLSLRLEPWLPARLLNTRLPRRFFGRVLHAGERVVRLLEWGLRPRWVVLLEHPILHHAYGVMILVAGLLLVLPLPIPFSNALPALVVVLTAGAMLERDGYCAVAALGVFAVTLAFFGGLVWGGALAADWLGEWFRGL
jgi:hypothetical protein